MKRALGAVTPWDTFKKMTEGNHAAAAAAFEAPPGVHVAPHVQEAAEAAQQPNGEVKHRGLPHSREDQEARSQAEEGKARAGSQGS